MLEVKAASILVDSLKIRWKAYSTKNVQLMSNAKILGKKQWGL